MRDDNCLFCKIVGGDIPSNKLYEDELCYAFYDIAPQAPTHFLVIPKDHIGSVAEVNGGNSAVVAHILRSSPGCAGNWAWRATGWCPTSASRPVRVCTICTSTYSPAAT